MWPISSRAAIELAKKAAGWSAVRKTASAARHNAPVANKAAFLSLSVRQAFRSREKERNPAPVQTRPNAYTIFTAPLPRTSAQRSLTSASVNMNAKKHSAKQIPHRSCG